MTISPYRQRPRIKDLGSAHAIADLQREIRALSSKVSVGLGSITSDKTKIIQLSDMTLNLGAVTAGSVTGGTIQTATGSIARTVMDSNGLYVTDTNGTTKLILLAHTGGLKLGANTGDTNNLANRIRWAKDNSDSTTILSYVGSHYDVTNSVAYIRIAAQTATSGSSEQAYLDLVGTSVGTNAGNGVTVSVKNAAGTNLYYRVLLDGNNNSGFLSLNNAPNGWTMTDIQSVAFTSVGAGATQTGATWSHLLNWSSQVVIGGFGSGSAVWSWGFSTTNNSVTVTARNNGSTTASGTFYYIVIGKP